MHSVTEKVTYMIEMIIQEKKEWKTINHKFGSYDETNYVRWHCIGKPSNILCIIIWVIICWTSKQALIIWHSWFINYKSCLMWLFNSSQMVTKASDIKPHFCTISAYPLMWVWVSFHSSTFYLQLLRKLASLLSKLTYS